MGRTFAEKILAENSGRKSVRPGEYVYAKVDLCLANDFTGVDTIEEFQRYHKNKIKDPSKVVLVPDHLIPPSDPQMAQIVRILREFAQEQGIEHFYDIGRGGVAHCLLPEKGLVSAGDLVIGADSLTCTYGALGAFAIGVGSTDVAATMVTGKCWFQVPHTIRVDFRGELPPWSSGKDLALYLLRHIGVDGAHHQAIEYHGEAVRRMSQAGRFTLCTMSNVVGAKIGMVEPDATTRSYLKEHTKRKSKIIKSDKNASYVARIEYDATRIRPQVALPVPNSTVHDVDELGHVPIDQVCIGSSANGWGE